MAKFQFRLQRVLDYRELEEKWAKDAFIEKQIARVGVETEIERIEAAKLSVTAGSANDLQSRLSFEAVLTRYDDEKRAQNSLLSLCQQEEDAAREEWTERRQAKEALIKLRNVALVEWQHDQDRIEQQELDEWTTSRFAA